MSEFWSGVLITMVILLIIILFGMAEGIEKLQEKNKNLQQQIDELPNYEDGLHEGFNNGYDWALEKVCGCGINEQR